MNKLILLLFFFISSFSASANDIVGTYKTYDDYNNNTMDTFDSYIGFGHANGVVTLRFMKNGVEQKVKCSEIWGFKLAERLYRIDQKFGQPACIISIGKIIYYENGPSYLDGYKNKKAVGVYSIGSLCYFSKNMNSEMVPYDPKVKESNTRFKEFKKSNPKFDVLFKCIGKSDDYAIIRPCVKNFNAGKAEE